MFHTVGNPELVRVVRTVLTLVLADKQFANHSPTTSHLKVKSEQLKNP